MRAAFNHQKSLYFPEISNPAADYVVMAFFTIAALLIAVRLVSWFRDYYSIVITLGTLSLGFVSALAVAGHITLVDLFGRDAGLLPYSTILGAIIGLYVFVVLAYIMNTDVADEAS